MQKAVLFTGTTGVGKSVILSGALERLRGAKTLVPFTINFSAQTQAIDTQVSLQITAVYNVSSVCISAQGFQKHCNLWVTLCATLFSPKIIM